jgi:hypothetical protein
MACEVKISADLEFCAPAAAAVAELLLKENSSDVSTNKTASDLGKQMGRSIGLSFAQELLIGATGFSMLMGKDCSSNEV